MNPPRTPIAYSAGLHVLAEFETLAVEKLAGLKPFETFIKAEIDALQLEKVGEVFHEFPGGGFTAVICLTESHLSIHTWPEYGKATFDVFLSNYKKENDGKARKLTDAILRFFDALHVSKTELKR